MLESYEVVESVAGKLEAEIIRSLLNSLHVEVYLSSEGAATAFGFGIGRMARVDIMVPETQALQAREIIAEYYSGKLAIETDEGSEQDQE